MRTDRSHGHPAASTTAAVDADVVDAELAVLVLAAVDVAVGVVGVVAGVEVLVVQEQVRRPCQHRSRNHSRNAEADVCALAEEQDHNRSLDPDSNHGVVATSQDKVLARVLVEEAAEAEQELVL